MYGGKKIILKKHELCLLLFAMYLIIFCSGFFSARVSSTEIREYIFHRIPPDLAATSSLDLPLPVPSSISTEIDKTRLDLEKISINKYFIIYSVIYGDQSHTAYHLYLTNLNREILDKNAVGKIYLLTETGEKIEPVAQLPVIEDFPTDQPLGWKIKIIVKFPYKTERENHSLVFNYLDTEFVLSKISY